MGSRRKFELQFEEDQHRKYTDCSFGVFIVNFGHISHLCSSVFIVNFEHVIAGCYHFVISNYSSNYSSNCIKFLLISNYKLKKLVKKQIVFYSPSNTFYLSKKSLRVKYLKNYTFTGMCSLFTWFVLQILNFMKTHQVLNRLSKCALT